MDIDWTVLEKVIMMATEVLGCNYQKVAGKELYKVVMLMKV